MNPMTQAHTNFYEEHAKTCAPDDYWGQIKRTINGRPIAQQQIDMIVDAIRTRLELRGDDRLLDLCCGNGALTTLLSPYCRDVTGVDLSPYLIGVAKRVFEKIPTQRYLLADAGDFVATHEDTEPFTVVLCYGSFMFLGEQVLLDLRRRFPRVRKVFLGNLPDRSLKHLFFSESGYTPSADTDLSSATGVWRDRDEMTELAARTGWYARFEHMPREFYAAHYRFDVILTPSHSADPDLP